MYIYAAVNELFLHRLHSKSLTTWPRTTFSLSLSWAVTHLPLPLHHWSFSSSSFPSSSKALAMECSQRAAICSEAVGCTISRTRCTTWRPRARSWRRNSIAWRTAGRIETISSTDGSPLDAACQGTVRSKVLLLFCCHPFPVISSIPFSYRGKLTPTFIRLLHSRKLFFFFFLSSFNVNPHFYNFLILLSRWIIHHKS